MTQTAGDRLLAAVLADPADDGPREAFADYLRETGQIARADFITAQLGVDTFFRRFGNPPADCKDPTCQCHAFDRRQVDLLEASRPGFDVLGGTPWAPGSPLWAFHGWLEGRMGVGLDYGTNNHLTHRLEIARGFVEAVSVHEEGFRRMARTLFRHQPVTAVHLAGKVPTFYPSLTSPPHAGWPAITAEYAWRDRGNAYAHPQRSSPFAAHVINGDVFAHLAGYVRRESGWAWYTSVTAAQAALSDACVAHGRRLAAAQPEEA
jgi:uncharacterized protein (TIGR02996 family)